MYSEINSIKDKCILDLNVNHFEEMCYNLNDILLKENMFLRIYEIKDKFRYLFHENKDSKNCLRSLSSCIKEKFNGFGRAELKLSTKEKTDLIPINILYKPVKKLGEFVKCYFVKDLKYAYRSVYEKSQKDFGANTLYECYYCNDFWVVKSKYERHLKVCGKKPGVIYDFTLKNIVTFEDNFKYYGDLPFAVYADFETTAPTQSHLNPEQKEMFAVSYSLIFASHPDLNLPRQMVVRGYNHSLEELSNLNYLTNEQLALRNQMTTHQLKDCVANVHSRRRKNSLVEMFNVELKFACDVLLIWFKKKLQKTALYNESTIEFKKYNPITSNTQCTICSFPLSTDVKGLEFKENQMSYLDFLIRKEYAFIKNIYDEDELKISEPLSSLEKYWQMMKRYIMMIKTAEIDLQSVYHFCEIENKNLQNILYKYLDAYEDNVPDLITLIKKFKVNYKPHHSISKYALQLYSFFYDCIMCFPTIKFDEIKTVSTAGFINRLYRVINYKVVIHHSHVIGEIIGYAHDFCNWQIRQNNYIIPLIGHNFWGFDIYYMVKGFRASVWETGDLNMGGTTLTNMNYAGISNQIKIIDTMKYYQTSLANIANTATSDEKVNIENTVVKFLEKHSYFSKEWYKLNQATKNKIVNIISKGKGAIPYEKIIDINSLDIKPENDFFEYSEYFSSLNNKNIEMNIYQDMKFLYQTLKMRNLGDMNDLYNMQDVILLCEIIENRFQKMQDKFGFNPHKCNSASTLSGCVQRDQSKVIISLPTNFKHAEIFEKTLIGGFTCINTRIGFDTEVLLPNFEDYSNIKIDENFQAYKNQNYKVAYKIKLDNDPIDYERRVISKILKFDENNQYGFAMTKPMPVGSIKEKQADYLEFNLLFEKLNLDDPIGHIFVVDIEFNYKEATKVQIMYNEIMSPFIEKNTIISAEKRSVYQLLELYSEDKNGSPNKYKTSTKAHVNLFPKKCIPLYLEEIKFGVLRCGWKVTKLYRHFYFDQERCKKKFILMNQKARQEATDKVESDFCKLLNNSNFGFDCRNNLDNLYFQPIRDENNELNYIKRYYTNLYDPKIKDFVTSKVIEDDINERYNNDILKLKVNDKFYHSKRSCIENRKRCEMESLTQFKE